MKDHGPELKTASAKARYLYVATEFANELSCRSLVLPSMPSVAKNVITLADNDDVSAQGLVDIIHQDQKFAAHLLRAVNAPTFRGIDEINDLQQAIARLGLSEVREIAMAIAIGNIFIGTPPYVYLVNRARKHGLRTALWAKAIADKTRLDPETAYLCGLLHNIGMPLVVKQVWELDNSLTEFDILQLLNRFETLTGQLISESWRLPPTICMVIRHHQDFASAPQSVDYAAAVNMASLIGHAQMNQALDPDLLQAFPAVGYLELGAAELHDLGEHEQQIDDEVDGLT